METADPPPRERRCVVVRTQFECMTAAVFVHKAALELPNPPEVIASAYKLTKTELRILLALVQLGGGPEIAEALGVGSGTVKTHLRNLFRKTGTKHQADLTW